MPPKQKVPTICKKFYRISTTIPISSATKPLVACGKAGSSTPKAMGLHRLDRFIETSDSWWIMNECGIYIPGYVETSVSILASSGGNVSEAIISRSFCSDYVYAWTYLRFPRGSDVSRDIWRAASETWISEIPFSTRSLHSLQSSIWNSRTLLSLSTRSSQM